MFEFLFIVVALSLNLLLVTAERVESECMKQAESVTVWFSAPVDQPPQMESIMPLPFEQSLLMCFTSPLQFHIPEKLGCSKKLEIQRGLYLLFYHFAHQLRLTTTRLYQVRETPTRVIPCALVCSEQFADTALFPPLCCEIRDAVLSQLSP